ncbi:unnamed protein product [Cylindrotheca closterium]|uniref:RING-type domain-containing protein n=1 Tax=Cylindrotheca closterium TaxID=2856 RepID=A0AAD2JH06_9STRA|nr:unnamed protein product [Cylindrotheca closterium]
MSISHASEEDAEKLKTDIASLVRVQDRLKKVSDATKLPSILSALLPRLLGRLEEYSIQTPSHRDSEILKLKTQAMEKTSEILTEATQRMKKDSEVEVKDVIKSILNFVHTKSPLAGTWALSILSVGMQRKNPSESIPSQTMAHLIYTVDAMHTEATDRLSPVYPNRYFTASWMLLDCLVLSATVRPLVSWHMEDHDWYIRYERHISQCDVSRDHKDAITAASTNGNGLFHLLLDLLLLPLSTPMQIRLYMSQISCMRMEHRHKPTRSRSSKTWYQEAKRPIWSNVAVSYLCHVKLIALRCASWPLNEGLFEATNRECAVVLNVLAASKETMHGRVALDFLGKLGGKYSLDTMLSLLVLLVGDENALQLQKDIGDSSSASWERILGHTPDSALMQRPPLPMHVGEGVMQFLTENELQEEDVSSDRRESITLTIDMCLAWTSTNEEGQGTSLSPIQMKQKWIYSIRLVKSIYQKLVAADLISEKNPDAWASDLIQKSLKMCFGVLSLVLEAGQSNVEKLRKRTRPVPGAPAPFGRRADLNDLLNDHREGQKRRQLSSDDAVASREAAYELISLLSGHAVEWSENFFQLPSLLLGCAIHEEEILQQSVTDALVHLLSAYIKALSSDWRQLLGAKTIKDSKQLATPLLPILLDAICADSLNARRNAKEWVEMILQILDSEAASFLSLCVTYIESGASAPSVTEVLNQLHGFVLPSEIGYTNLNDNRGMKPIQSTIHSDVMDLISKYQMPYHAAQCILSDHSFSLVEAKASCQSDLKTLLEPFKTSGMDENISYAQDDVTLCGICYDEVPSDESYSLKCCHAFCKSCWCFFVDEAGDNSPSGLLSLTCPQHECTARVTSRDLEVIDASYCNTFETSTVHAFVQSKPTHRFCPGPDYHVCNQYIESGDSNDDLQRGLFLAKRYEAHEDAQLFTKDQKQNLENRPLNQIEEEYFETLQTGLEVVMEARIFLKHSYMATFGLRGNQTKLTELESHQGALEVLTEKLNQLTEMNVHRIYREQGKQSLTMHFQRLSFYLFSVCTYMTRILDLDLETD